MFALFPEADVVTALADGIVTEASVEVGAHIKLNHAARRIGHQHERVGVLGAGSWRRAICAACSHLSRWPRVSSSWSRRIWFNCLRAEISASSAVPLRGSVSGR